MKLPNAAETIVEQTEKRVKAETIIKLLEMLYNKLTLEQAIQELKKQK